MNRIEERFAQLKRDGKKGFIVYIGAGDPNLAATRELALAFDKAGVDVLELGVPFSDPLADGLVNQLAAQRGLESGTTPPKVLQTVAAIRKRFANSRSSSTFISISSTASAWRNSSPPRRRRAWTACSCSICRRRNRDNYEALMNQAGLCHIYLVAPTTPEDRMEFIVKRGSGFIYYISREGVTGMQSEGRVEPRAAGRQNPRAHATARRRRLRHFESRNRPRLVAQNADAVVVGSAVVNQIAEHGKSKTWSSASAGL